MNMNFPSRLIVSCFALFACAGAAQANDNLISANYELQSLLGAGGRAYATSQDYTHNTGAYVCRSTGAGTTVVTFPFVVPDAQRLNFVTVTGKRTSVAPPLKLQVIESCMGWQAVLPTTTVRGEMVPDPNSAGFFTAHLYLGSLAPNNYDCKYRVAALFDTSTVKCTSGDSLIQKITVWSTVPDRIFRGSFHTNVTMDAP